MRFQIERCRVWNRRLTGTESGRFIKTDLASMDELKTFKAKVSSEKPFDLPAVSHRSQCVDACIMNQDS